MTGRTDRSVVFTHCEPCPGAGTRELDEFTRRVRACRSAVDIEDLDASQT